MLSLCVFGVAQVACAQVARWAPFLVRPSTARVAAKLILGIALSSTAAGQVIFTEYVEGAGHNKALEITNVSDAPFDLSVCRIGMYFNGATTRGQDFTLIGVLAPGASHVFYHSETGGTYSHEFLAAVGAAPSSQSAGFGWFNGDDAIVLECQGQVFDSLGQVGVQEKWGQDLTLRRSSGPGKTDPKSEWRPDDLGWQRLPNNTFDGLGHR